MIVALLSFYDEKADWLGECVRSLAPFADHLVAVDGAYALFPGARAVSPAVQAEVIRGAARASGMCLTLFEPACPWDGNEVEKRTVMFELAETVAGCRDWYFVIDADEVVTDIGVDVRAMLEGTGFDVGSVTGWQMNGPGRQPMRRFFRAVPGLTVFGNHCTYMTPDGRCLWGPGCELSEPAIELSALMVQHRKEGRDPSRQQGANDYYQRRDLLDVERAVGL